MGQMTHYMELLATNQPWNLLIFMAGPIILAETIAIAELYLLFTRNFNGIIKKISSIAGIIVGIYFMGIFIYLFINAVIPITSGGQWRTFIDVIAVGSYLLCVVPLVGIALIEIGIIGKGKDPLEKLKLHAIFVGIFLIVAHIAMIMGMMSPDVITGNTQNMHM